MIDLYNFDFEKYAETKELVYIIVALNNKSLPLVDDCISFTKLGVLTAKVDTTISNDFTFRVIDKKFSGLYTPVVELVFDNKLEAEKIKLEIIKAQYKDFMNYVEKEFKDYPEYAL